MTGLKNDHPITIAPNPHRIRVHWRGHVVADTTRALNLKEASYPAVLYIPRADVDMALLERSAHQTRCPHKGVASYYSLTSADGRSENAIWTYESPLPTVASIAGHVAFYPDRIDRIEQSPAP